MDFIRDFFKHGKPVAAICHGPAFCAKAIEEFAKGRHAECHVEVAVTSGGVGTRAIRIDDL